MGHACERSPRPQTGDEDVYIGHIFENLCPRGLIVRESVRLIPVLVEHHIALVLCGQFLRQPASACTRRAPASASEATRTTSCSCCEARLSRRARVSRLLARAAIWFAAATISSKNGASSAPIHWRLRRRTSAS